MFFLKGLLKDSLTSLVIGSLFLLSFLLIGMGIYKEFFQISLPTSPYTVWSSIGTVEVRRENSAKPISLTKGMSLFRNDEIIVHESAKVDISKEGQPWFSVNAKSRVLMTPLYHEFW